MKVQLKIKHSSSTFIICSLMDLCQLSRQWVDTIRTKRNEATHEINLMTKEDAEMLVTFSGMVLLAIYQFPNQASPPPPSIAINTEVEHYPTFSQITKCAEEPLWVLNVTQSLSCIL
jgi:hypothetical protein